MSVPHTSVFNCDFSYIIIGASLSEPHPSLLNCDFFIYIYLPACLPAVRHSVNQRDRAQCAVETTEQRSERLRKRQLKSQLNPSIAYIYIVLYILDLVNLM